MYEGELNWYFIEHLLSHMHTSAYFNKIFQKREEEFLGISLLIYDIRINGLKIREGVPIKKDSLQ